MTRRVPDDVVQLVAADVVGTLGWSQERAEELVHANSGGWYAEGGPPRVLLVAEDVQQFLHDDRIDTSWPSCPDHPNHPLRLSETLPAMWTCPTTGRTVCALGNLAAVTGQ